MKENYKKEYEAPMVELIEARVEKGFEVSGDPTELTKYAVKSGQESKFN
ncbi:MAG: hypothetical protein J5641_02645 [Bacteroidales bacterium]|nr:hypothetical protein [Bacteroidales bacterium]